MTRHLKTIIGPGEKELRRVERRREKGIREREVYLKQHSENRAQKAQIALDLREQGLNNTQIAESLGITKRTVQRYFND